MEKNAPWTLGSALQTALIGGLAAAFSLAKLISN
jgi:hypothetical protein